MNALGWGFAVSVSLFALVGCGTPEAPAEAKGSSESHLDCGDDCGTDDPGDIRRETQRETGGLPVLVTWNGVANTEASLDIILNNGKVIGPCVGVDVLRWEYETGRSDGLGYLFTGTCASADWSPFAADIYSFRVCTAWASPDGWDDWSHATCTESAPWDHTNMAVHIDNYY